MGRTAEEKRAANAESARLCRKRKAERLATLQQSNNALKRRLMEVEGYNVSLQNAYVVTQPTVAPAIVHMPIAHVPTLPLEPVNIQPHTIVPPPAPSAGWGMFQIPAAVQEDAATRSSGLSCQPTSTTAATPAVFAPTVSASMSTSEIGEAQCAESISGLQSSSNEEECPFEYACLNWIVTGADKDHISEDCLSSAEGSQT